MNKIYQYAFRKAWSSDEINEVVLEDLLSDLDNDVRTRFVEAAIGLVDLNKIKSDIPATSKIGDKTCRFESYNYLTDTVRYEYAYADVRYFPTQDDADAYTASGKYTWGKSSSASSNEYPYLGSWERSSYSATDLNSWKEGAK